MNGKVTGLNMNNDNFKIATGFLAEVKGEFVTTRRFLERLPQESLLWKPHEKSMTAGQLAFHIADLPARLLSMGILESAEVPDMSQREQPETVLQILAVLEHSEKQLLEVLPTLSDESMHAVVRITKDGKELAVLPRVGFLRSAMLNHWYHHRGQFGVYLRMLGCAVPRSYGPSADED